MAKAKGKGGKSAAKAKAKKKRRAGKVRGVPRKVLSSVMKAVNHVRMAKKHMEAKAPKSRKAWAVLHDAESRLTRLV